MRGGEFLRGLTARCISQTRLIWKIYIKTIYYTTNVSRKCGKITINRPAKIFLASLIVHLDWVSLSFILMNLFIFITIVNIY